MQEPKRLRFTNPKGVKIAGIGKSKIKLEIKLGDEPTTVQVRDSVITVQATQTKRNTYLSVLLEKDNSMSFDKITNLFWCLAGKCTVFNIFSVFSCRGFAKEMLECAATVSYFTDLRECQDTTRFYVLGDGVAPRTGTLLNAAFPNAHVTSIDPLFSDEFVGVRGNFTCIKGYAPADIEFTPGECMTAFVSVHGHAPVVNIVSEFRREYPSAKVTVVTIPCCDMNQQLLPDEPKAIMQLPTFNTQQASSKLYVYCY
jgi:hypothetical protein